MRLTEEQLDWLRRRIPGAQAAADNLVATYALATSVGPVTPAARRVAVHPRDTHLFWRFDLVDESGQPLNEDWIARSVYAEACLHGGTGQAAVAEHARLVLRAPYRRLGLGRSIHAREQQLYRRWRIREIHMNAQQDGPVVWVRSFGFIPVDQQPLWAEWRSWARRRRLDPAAVTTCSQLPEAFLSGYSSLELYKVVE
jgi:GNAT superfamily N-acetyltransferase